jgi:hypothetical protein
MREQIELDLVALERVIYAAVTPITPEMALEIQVSRDLVINDMIMVSLRQAFLARKVDNAIVRYPADWWQAFKRRFFPAWALRRWPVLEHAVNVSIWHDYIGVQVPVKGVYPQIGFEQSDAQQVESD